MFHPIFHDSNITIEETNTWSTNSFTLPNVTVSNSGINLSHNISAGTANMNVSGTAMVTLMRWIANIPTFHNIGVGFPHIDGTGGATWSNTSSLGYTKASRTSPGQFPSHSWVESSPKRKLGRRGQSVGSSSTKGTFSRIIGYLRRKR